MILHVTEASMVYGSVTLVELHLHPAHGHVSRTDLEGVPSFSLLLDGNIVSAWLVSSVVSDKLIACCKSKSEAGLLRKIRNTTIQLNRDSDPIEDAALLQKISAGVT